MTLNLGARSYFQTIFRTIAGLTLVMGTMMWWTHGSNFESLKIESAINEYMSVANTHMHRRAMEGSADTSIDISAYEGIDQTLLSFLSKSSYAREKVIEMVIDLYTSPSSPRDLLTDKLDNAIEAIDLVETDGEPIQVKGYPFLFVGSVGEIVIHYFHWRLPLHISNLISLLCPQGHLWITKPYTRMESHMWSICLHQLNATYLMISITCASLVFEEAMRCEAI